VQGDSAGAYLFINEANKATFEAPEAFARRTTIRSRFPGCHDAHRAADAAPATALGAARRGVVSRKVVGYVLPRTFVRT
jgi:hypothetical protein